MTLVIDDPEQLNVRLSELGLKLEWLTSAALRGDAGAGASTALHPPGDPGFRRWSDTTAGLRANVLPHSWEMSNALNYCTVFNRATRTAIVVMAGDVFTGSRLGTPRSRYPKGIATESRIGINNGQQSFFPQMKSPAEILEADCVTYALVQFDGAEGIQLELSQPSSMSASGYVNDWRERLLLPTVNPQGIGVTVVAERDASEAAVDFVVERR